MLVGLLTLLLPALALAQAVAPMTPEEHAVRAGAAPAPAPVPPRGHADDIDALKAASAGPRVLPGPVQPDLSAAAVALPLPVGPSAPTLTTSFAAQTFLDAFSTPPDPVLAAGPHNLVVITNGRTRIYSKAGGVLADATMNQFFGPMSPESAFDPKVIFDPHSQRFFASAVSAANFDSFCSPGSCLAHHFLAVSKTDTPTTLDSASWNFYTFDATADNGTPTSNWGDFPQLGIDPNVVVITTNQFMFGGGFA